MPGKITIRIEGAAEMARLLKELGPQVARRTGQQAVKAAAVPIVDRAKQLVPVRTGALKKAISSEAVRRGAGADSVIQAIGWEKPWSRYGHLVEFGTAHSAAQPHMRPALDEQKIAALDEMGRVLAAGIERAAERLAGLHGTKRKRL